MESGIISRKSETRLPQFKAAAVVFWKILRNSGEIDMNYAEIKRCDIANGPGVRVSLFVSGCTHRCKNCFNEVAWDFSYGKPFDEATQDLLIRELSPDYISGLTLLGGEPLETENQAGLLPFLERVKAELPGKTIWCFTGYLFEKDVLGRMLENVPETKRILELIDILVDGPFIEAQKNISLQFRGSSNQRIIDVQESLRQGTTVIWKELRETGCQKK